MAGKTRIGAELFCAPDLRQALDAARQDGLDFACSPLSHPRNARDARGVSERRAAPETRSDLALTCGDAEDKAREMHAAFLRAYPEIDPAAFPLQRLRTANWERPFENA